MRHFKLALIVTGIAFVLTIVVGIVGVLMIQRSGATAAQLQARSSMLGQGAGVVFCLVIAPFWIFGAYKLGKERRAEKEKPKVQRRKPNRPSL